MSKVYVPPYQRSAEPDFQKWPSNSNGDRRFHANESTFRNGPNHGAPTTARVQGQEQFRSHMIDDKDVEGLFQNRISSGINFEKYNDIPVEVTPHYEKVTPIESFAQIQGLHHLLASNIQRSKYVKPTPVQKYAIPIGINGRDLMACAQTGSGKTAAFLFPMINVLLHRGPIPKSYQAKPAVIILAPTRELATQIYDEARKFTFQTFLKAVVVYGGADIRHQLQQLFQGCDILIGTPGRLHDMMERGKVSLSQVQFAVLDEADRMLDMGFEPKIREIMQQSDIPQPANRQTMMFSATFPKPIQQLAGEFLNRYIFLTVGRVGSTTEFITQKLEWVEDKQKKEHLKAFLSEEVRDGERKLILIFVETKRDCDSLDYYLRQHGFQSTCIHGDRVQYEREQALRSFKSGRTPIMVATDVASRGLDIPNVTEVIQYDLPHSIDDYVHRIGRTGRAGNIGTAIAYFNEKNKPIATEVFQLLQEANQEIPPWLQQMVSQKMRVNTRGNGQRRGGSYGGKDYRNYGQNHHYGGGKGYHHNNHHGSGGSHSSHNHNNGSNFYGNHSQNGNAHHGINAHSTVPSHAQAPHIPPHQIQGLRVPAVQGQTRAGWGYNPQQTPAAAPHHQAPVHWPQDYQFTPAANGNGYEFRYQDI